MEFVLTNGVKYISHSSDGRYVLVNDISKAETYSKLTTAANVLNNSVPKTISFGFKPLSREYAAIYENKKPNKQLKATPLRTSDNGPKQCPLPESGTSEINEWIKRLSGMRNITVDMAARKDSLVNSLSTLDLALSDLRHYAEANTLNAVEGYKFYKAVHDVSVRRRQVKDELAVIHTIEELRINDKDIENAISSINRICSRKYIPRVLDVSRGIDASAIVREI